MSIAEKLTTIAENQQKVYDAGYSAGQQAGGGDNYYDELWDSLQGNGTRTNYSGAFGIVWNDDNFRPKYDIRPANATHIFKYSKITDLQAICERQGIVFDLSGVTNNGVVQMFENSSITRVGTIDLSSVKNPTYVFYAAMQLHTIEKLIFAETNVIVDNWFQECRKLENLNVVEGVIASSINFKWSPLLSRASIKNILSVLSDTVEGKTATFSKTAVDKAFETSEGANDGSTNELSEWFTLINGDDVGGWTFALA